MIYIDSLADIHLDFWARKDKKKIKNFIGKLLSAKQQEIYDVIVITGDIGHYNEDNFIFIEKLASYYDRVIVTWGNHDLYLLKSQVYKYNFNSFNKLNELKTEINKIKNARFLDGNTVIHKDKIFWGSGLWYEVTDLAHWASVMNDSVYIYDENGTYKIVTSYSFNSLKANFNPFELYEKEKEKIEKIESKIDFIVSHMPPINFKTGDDRTSEYFYFDKGVEYLTKIKPLAWFFGHNHYKYTGTFGNTMLINNPVGYPSEKKEIKIETFSF